MPFIAGPETFDTASQVASCVYPPTAVGGAPMPTTVMTGGAPLMIISGAPDPFPCAPVGGINVNPVVPIPCPPVPRFIVPKVNKTVIINGKLAAVTGDEATLAIGGGPRPLTGPFRYPTIVIGSKL